MIATEISKATTAPSFQKRWTKGLRPERSSGVANVTAVGALCWAMAGTSGNRPGRAHGLGRGSKTPLPTGGPGERGSLPDGPGEPQVEHAGGPARLRGQPLGVR